MASSPHAVLHSHDCHPATLESAQPSHPSHGTTLSDRPRTLEAPARKSDPCAGAAARVFSRSSDVWLEGQVVEFDGKFVRVQFEHGEQQYAKTLHINSEHLDMQNALRASPTQCSPRCFATKHPGSRGDSRDIEDSFIRGLECRANDGSLKAMIELLSMADLNNVMAKAALERLGDVDTPRPEVLQVEVTPSMKHMQGTEPTKWAMTLYQWNKVFEECKRSSLFKEIQIPKRSFERFVSVYDINDYFVKPWTRGKGCGIALHMNPDGLDAQVMVSHAWGEDFEELHQSLNKHFESQSIGKDKAIWFCTFAQYQVEDGVGPSIETQLKLDPFTKVIEFAGVEMMLAVHTTTADPYERLWCVREVDEALLLPKKIRAVFSDKYADQIKEQYSKVISSGGTDHDGMEKAGLTVHASRSKCRKEDEAVLLKKLFSRDGGFERIDEAVTAFRRSEVIAVIIGVLRAEALKGNPLALVDLLKQGNLQAVDLLYDVAESEDQPAHDALCTALKTIADANNTGMMHGWSSFCWKDHQPAFHLVIILLQTMANRQHKASFDLLAQFEWKPSWSMVSDHFACVDFACVERWEDLCKGNPKEEGYRKFLKSAKEKHKAPVEAYRNNVDVDAWRRQHTMHSLQALAKQGNERAVGTLVDSSKDGCSNSKLALQSLAEQWNRPVLIALRELAEGGDERARDVLDRCQQSLRTAFG